MPIEKEKKRRGSGREGGDSVRLTRQRRDGNADDGVEKAENEPQRHRAPLLHKQHRIAFDTRGTEIDTRRCRRAAASSWSFDLEKIFQTKPAAR